MFFKRIKEESKQTIYAVSGGVVGLFLLYRLIQLNKKQQSVVLPIQDQVLQPPAPITRPVPQVPPSQPPQQPITGPFYPNFQALVENFNSILDSAEQEFGLIDTLDSATLDALSWIYAPGVQIPSEADYHRYIARFILPGIQHGFRCTPSPQPYFTNSRDFGILISKDTRGSFRMQVVRP